jgi:hypothetical protein
LSAATIVTPYQDGGREIGDFEYRIGRTAHRPTYFRSFEED